MIVLVGMQEKLAQKSKTLSEISLQETPRFTSGFKELDRVLGGGIVPGSAILLVVILVPVKVPCYFK